MAYRNLARRIMGDEVPFMQLNQSNGFFQRIARIFGGKNG
jgi:septum site-determining protein MinD